MKSLQSSKQVEELQGSALASATDPNRTVVPLAAYPASGQSRAGLAVTRKGRPGESQEAEDSGAKDVTPPAAHDKYAITGEAPPPAQEDEMVVKPAARDDQTELNRRLREQHRALASMHQKLRECEACISQMQNWSLDRACKVRQYQLGKTATPGANGGQPFSSGEQPTPAPAPPPRRYIAPDDGPPVDENFRPLPVQ